MTTKNNDNQVTQVKTIKAGSLTPKTKKIAETLGDIPEQSLFKKD